MRPSFLRPVAGRRGRRQSRSGGGLFNLSRLLGALLMLGASASLNWLTAPDRFELDPAAVTVKGLHHTPAQAASAILDPVVDERPNIFRLRTAALARELVELPAVASVDIRAGLTGALAISVTERVPVLTWQVGTQGLLVDADGVVISPASEPLTELPAVTDRRTGAAAPEIGSRIDSIDLAAALRLAALTPPLLGSRASGLELEVEDEHGWLLSARSPMSWRAVFGHYTPNLRPTAMIDQQVQCLRSLLASSETEIEMVFLAPSEDRCGTFRARPTPRGRIFQNVAGGRPAAAGTAA